MVDAVTYALAKSYTDAHGSDPGTSNYNELENRPQIESTTLTGNKSASDLGLAKEPTIQDTMLIF